MWRALLLLLALAAAPPARAELPSLGTAQVAAALDGETLRLADGRLVRLAGVAPPGSPPGRSIPGVAALAEAARSALDRLVRGRAVELRSAGTPRDRYGRVVAQVWRADDRLWIQGEMLRRGLARVASLPDNRALVPEMLAIEAEARDARRGLWRHWYFAIREPGQTARDLDSFQIVQGEVAATAKVRGQIFLNFGADWHEDFTVHIARAALRLFRAAGRDPMALGGRRIRVRGWVREWNGPLLEVTHPEQIELLPP